MTLPPSHRPPPPTADDPNKDKLFRLEARPTGGGAALYVPCNTVLVASGASDGIIERLGFTSKVMATSSALGLVAHFRNRKTAQERNLEEFSWASQYNKRLFDQLRALGADLENVVYYQGETHYFIMTPKKASLLQAGVLKRDLSPHSRLVAADNLDMAKLREYARSVADFFDIPSSSEFVTEVRLATARLTRWLPFIYFYFFIFFFCVCVCVARR